MPKEITQTDDRINGRPRLYTVSRGAKLVGVGRSKLYRLIKRGAPTVRVIATTMVDPDDVVAWLKAGGGAE